MKRTAMEIIGAIVVFELGEWIGINRNHRLNLKQNRKKFVAKFQYEKLEKENELLKVKNQFANWIFENIRTMSMEEFNVAVAEQIAYIKIVEESQK